MYKTKDEYEAGVARAAVIRKDVLAREREGLAKAGFAIALCAALSLGAWNAYMAFADTTGLGLVLSLALGAIFSLCVCYALPRAAGGLFGRARLSGDMAYQAGGIALSSLSAAAVAFLVVMKMGQAEAPGIIPSPYSMHGGGIPLTVLLTLAMAACFVMALLKGYAGGTPAASEEMEV